MQIAIISIGSRGDVQPYVALGKGFQKAGHAVRVVTHAPFEEFVRGEGLDFASSGGDPRALVAALFKGEQSEDGTASKPPFGLPKGLVAARDMLREARDVVKTFTQGATEMIDNCWRASQDADALILNSLGALMGIPVARKLRIPVFLADLQPITPTAEFPPFFLPPIPCWLAAVRPHYNRLAWKLADRFRWQTFNKSSEVAQQVLNLPIQSPLKQVRELNPPVLYGYSPSFLPQPGDWPAHCHVTGYWFLDARKDWQPSAALLDFLGSGPPPVYIGFGSMIDRAPEEMGRLIIEALERSQQRGILLTGWGAISKGRVPDHVLVLDSVPHDWLFPRMAAVVHHGGAGTTGAGLRAGIPTVTVPFTADQPFWGQQVYARGVGPKPIPHRRLSAETLAEVIKMAVTDKAILARAEALGEKIRAEDGVGKAIDVISRHMQMSLPRLR